MNWKEHDAYLKTAKESIYTILNKECSQDDVIRIWESVSQFIISKMMEGKSVRVSGLGTFTFRIHKSQINQKSEKVSKDPIFVMSEHLKQNMLITQDKVLTSQVPLVCLNLSVIANATKIPRTLIESVITEVLQALARAVVSIENNKSLTFPFPFIGKLQIRNQKVTMTFCDEFCKKLGFHMVETVKFPEYL